MSIPPCIKVGSRIQVKSDIGTVLYIGPTSNDSGNWLGVEWDDPNRGKHDGLHHGTRYFQCKYPTSGSFLRYHPTKVLSGIPFLRALIDRYLSIYRDADPYDPENDVGLLYLGGNTNIEVETVGFEKVQRKQSQLSSLKVVGLSERSISSAGEVGEIKKADLYIQDIDLSRNLINSWNTVADITSQLPHLLYLRLNHSRLTAPPTDISSLYSNTISPFAHLTALSLNNTNITWADLLLVEPLFEQLTNLQMGKNNLTFLWGKEIPHENVFKKLKCLNLESNELDDWNEILPLGQLKSLEKLFLNDNKLCKLQTRVPDTFQKLTLLWLDTNQINSWECISELDTFSTLVDLRCKRNSIFEGLGVEEGLAQIVGRIRSVSIVNGNTIDSKKRTDLERYYLSQCTQNRDTHDEIAAIHPRYRELCKVHGEPDLSTATNTKISTVLMDKLTRAVFKHYSLSPEALNSCSYAKDLPSPIKEAEKRILPTMLIRNIRKIIQKLLMVPADEQQLFLVHYLQTDTNEQSIVVMDISDDKKDLRHYGITEGDEIFVLNKA